MRIDRLDLLRYGKFTDRVLVFPQARQDFHLVVGPNEAGKSTTRSAILDLLYGIETRSNFDFVHAKTTMRLGARLSHGAAVLEFVRIKARLKNLLGPGDVVLPEQVLNDYLAGTDRAYFDQMFGLDHARLEAGGHAILNAADDIGQILFQSAAGIASLGPVRARLEQEAQGLWAPRRAADRVYYRASDELAEAEAALKAATVRTKDWLAARERVEVLEQRRAALYQDHAALEAERLRLERIRRVGPALRQWRSLQGELALLAGAVRLPDDAARQLAAAELELATATRERQWHDTRAAELRVQLQAIPVDERLLGHASAVQALVERRQQTRHHGRDIERRRHELAAQWQQAEALLRQLGWTAQEEDDLRRLLPPLPTRKLLAELARRAPVLEQARVAAQAALAEHEAEQAALDRQLEGLSVQSVPPALRLALRAARALGDRSASQAREQQALDRCERERAQAFSALGAWRMPAERLRGLLLPAPSEVAARLEQHRELAAQQQQLRAQSEELARTMRRLQLEAEQFRRTHQPVGLAELQQARAARDRVWQEIKAGASPLDQAAPRFEAQVNEADQLADARHDKAQAVSEWQARLDALQRLQLQADEAAAQLDAAVAEAERHAAQWSDAAESVGLPGLPLSGVESWRTAREQALKAEAAWAEAAAQAADGERRAAAAVSALAAALYDAGTPTAAGTPFDQLLLLAADRVDSAAALQAQLDAGRRQQQAAAATGQRLQDRCTTAQAAWSAWQGDWEAAMAAVALPAGSPVALAEGALQLMNTLDPMLRVMQDLREQRIDAMQRDLDEVAQDLAALLPQVAPALVDRPADEVVPELAARLSRAIDAHKDRERLQRELADSETQARSAAERLARAQASLAPLMGLAGTTEVAALHAHIAASDQRRQLEAAAQAAQALVDSGSDGLAPEVLEAELAATDLATLAAQVAELAARQDRMRLDSDALTIELTDAARALAAIAGQDAAAQAEGRRQDALAKMGDAADRFVRVHTAARLLRWAIDRYRETRQGPVLQRAGAVFAALTLASFERLRVDFDHDPPSLHGQRADGTLVAIDGMSEGTRDQLYLALRLASLELHLGQGHALPFIADDLFINYDDARARAGLQALAQLSEQTQVIFLSHHDHLVPVAREVFGAGLNVVGL
jgi:uncharacterized protein YhaN